MTFAVRRVSAGPTARYIVMLHSKHR